MHEIRLLRFERLEVRSMGPLNSEKPLVIMQRHDACMSIILNRTEVLNSLNLEMVRAITAHLREALADDDCKLVLFYSEDGRAFCAGGDIRRIYRDDQSGNWADVNSFFLEEFSLDLMIHRFPKPVIVVVDGLTMGGGLGIAEGADWVIATERTRMAMPETRIGFYPDVGATGWLFQKCPPGYPEYLGLTSHEMKGGECVRLGLATHLTPSGKVRDLVGTIETFTQKGISHPRELLSLLMRKVNHCFERNIEPNPEGDRWVAEYFAGKTSVPGILESLQVCGLQPAPCEYLFSGLSERSPTALVMTLALMRHNEHLPMDKVFDTDFKAVQYILRHPDFLEGVRARIIEKDNQPRWTPDSIEKVDLSGLVLS
jgi:enoyl-CoA hydratase/carnithine racemase